MISVFYCNRSRSPTISSFRLACKQRKTSKFRRLAIGFAVSGFILTLLGGAMTLTWPLSKVGFPFDDIIFGEPSPAFGVMLLAGAIIL